MKFSFKDLKEEGFRDAYYCGIPIYIKEMDSEAPMAIGQNVFYNILFNFVSWININIRMDEGFEFKVPLTPEEIEKYKDEIEAWKKSQDK